MQHITISCLIKQHVQSALSKQQLISANSQRTTILKFKESQKYIITNLDNKFSTQFMSLMKKWQSDILFNSYQDVKITSAYEAYKSPSDLVPYLKSCKHAFHEPCTDA